MMARLIAASISIAIAAAAVDGDASHCFFLGARSTLPRGDFPALPFPIFLPPAGYTPSFDGAPAQGLRQRQPNNWVPLVSPGEQQVASCPRDTALCYSAFGTFISARRRTLHGARVQSKPGDHFSSFGCADANLRQDLVNLFGVSALEQVGRGCVLLKSHKLPPSYSGAPNSAAGRSVLAPGQHRGGVEAMFCFCEGDRCNDGAALETRVKEFYLRRAEAEAAREFRGLRPILPPDSSDRLAPFRGETSRVVYARGPTIAPDRIQPTRGERQQRFACHRSFLRTPQNGAVTDADLLTTPEWMDELEESLRSPRPTDCPLGTSFCFLLNGTQPAFPSLADRTSVAHEHFLWRGCFSPKTRRIFEKVYLVWLKDAQNGAIEDRFRQEAPASVDDSHDVERCFQFRMARSQVEGNLCLCRGAMCSGQDELDDIAASRPVAGVGFDDDAQLIEPKNSLDEDDVRSDGATARQREARLLSGGEPAAQTRSDDQVGEDDDAPSRASHFSSFFLSLILSVVTLAVCR